jgi:hypothetical protein
MNLKQVKTKAIQLIKQYSNNGTIITDSENADYLLSMNSFINDAQFELAAKRPILNKQYPDVIDNNTSDNTNLEVDLDCQMIIPYYIAGHTIIDENLELANYFLGEYDKKMRAIKTKATRTPITNVYGSFSAEVVE